MRLRDIVLSLSLLSLAAIAQQPIAVPQHESNFEEERAQANALFQQTKPLDALPLYEDLCRQDPTVAVFAERHAAGLFAKEGITSDPKERARIHSEGIAELKRAQKLGDNSNYVRMALASEARSFVGAVVSSIPLTPGYTYNSTPEARAVFMQAEAAFSHADWNGAASLYIQAAALDPKWYLPPLEAGDCYFRLNDIANAGIWFSKAISIDPDRDTAYRYWGDALLHAGQPDAAREKFVQAIVAEPYGRPAFLALGQWAQHTGHQLAKPTVQRPDFTLSAPGTLKIDPALAASTTDGRSSWIVYQQYRVVHGATSLNQVIVAGGSDANAVVKPSGYQHTIAEEHAALRAMLADIDAKLKDGELTEANLDGSVRNIRALERDNALGAWIAINEADAGIRQDYPAYRANHRKHLIDYVNNVLIH